MVSLKPENQSIPDFVRKAKKAIRPKHLTRPHPGAVFKRRYIDKSEEHRDQIAEHLDISPEYLSDFVNGHIELSIDLALRLEYVTGISAETWMNYKAAYEKYKAIN